MSAPDVFARFSSTPGLFRYVLSDGRIVDVEGMLESAARNYAAGLLVHPVGTGKGKDRIEAALVLRQPEAELELEANPYVEEIARPASEAVTSEELRDRATPTPLGNPRKGRRRATELDHLHRAPGT